MPVYDGEWEVRLKYTTVVSGATQSHVHTFDVLLEEPATLGQDPSTILLFTHSAGTNNLESAINAYVDFVRAFYQTTATFVVAELWQYDAEPSLAANYITSVPLGLAGLHANPTVPAGQATITIRTEGGRMARLQFMESVVGTDIRDPYPFAVTEINDLAEWAVSSVSVIYGRDGTQLKVPNNACYGTNERLWRKRFRQT